MAKDLNRSIKIFLDNTSAMTSADALQKSIGKLEGKLIDLQTAGKGNTDQAKKVEKELIAQTKKFETYKQKVAETERVVRNLSGATYDELIGAKKELDKQLKKTTRGTDEYNQKLILHKRLGKEIALVQRDMRTELGCQSTMWGRSADFINKYMGLIGSAIAGVTGITMAFNKLREERNKLEESKADVKALTGLDDESIEWLTTQAKQLSTTVTKEGIRIRQSATEILEAYKLVGSAKPELLANKEALAAVTEQTLILASASGMKLTDAVDAVTLAMNQYGAGADEAAKYVNALAAGSKFGAVAVESQTSAITKSGVSAAAANIPIEQLIGTIETLGEKGIKDEIAGTGLKKFFLTLQTGANETNPKVVGLTTALENLRKKQMDAAAVKKMFGEEGYNVASVLINEADKVDYYTKAVTGTTVAMEQAAIKSETAASNMDQARNKMTDMGVELMEKLNPAITGAMNQTVRWTGKLLTLATWISKNATEILAVVVGIAAYTVATKTSVIAAKLQVFWNEKIIVSLKSMYDTMLKNPYVLMGAVVLTWLLYMKKANSELVQMEAVQKRLNKVETEAAQSIVRQKTELEQFLRVARDESESKERRLSAIKKINEISPEYLGHLTLEEINTGKATIAINKYIDSIYEMAKAQAAKEQLIEIEKEKIRLDTDPEAFQELIPWWEKMEIGFLGLINKDRADRALSAMVDRGRSRRDKTKQSLDSQAEALRKMIADNSKNISDILSDDTTAVPGNSGVTDAKAEKKILDAKLKEVDQYVLQEQLKLKGSYLQNLMDKEDYNRQLEMLELDALNRRMTIYGLDKDKQAEIQDKILSYKVKILEQTRKFEESQDKYRQKADKKEEKAKEKGLNDELKRVVAKNNEQQATEYDEQQKHQERLKELASGFSTEIGAILGGAIAGNNDLVKSSLIAIINMGLDALEVTAQMAAAEAVIKGGGQGGLIGLAKGALVAGLIKIAFSGVKALVGSMVNNIGKGDSASSGVSSNSSSQNTGNRIVANGFLDGGYTGDYGVMEVAGVVHGKEYVIPHWEMEEPKAIPHIKAIDAIRRQKTNVNSLPVEGFANGGYTGRTAESDKPQPAESIVGNEAIKRLSDLLQKLDKEGLRAYVVYSDIERKKQTLEKTRRLGGK